MERSTPGGCPDDETLFRLVQGRLGDAARRDLDEHLYRCRACRGVVAEASRFLFQEKLPPASAAIPSPAAGAAPSPPPATLLARDTGVSRYRIMDAVGEGGAGVVYRAFDPELHRQIALKLIRADVSVSMSLREAHARLLREARAMAQLAHPNVVAVYDAGTYEGQVFVVMELVEGRTLAAWLRETARPWREVVAAFLDAGQGLAAAHAAGLVHRDFKPENVLIGTDGRVRVTDFGLARPGGPARAVEPIGDGPAGGAPMPPTSTSTLPEVSPQPSAAAAVTRFAGTPAYMAPEQFLGRTVDARTDQFSFCVALHVALYGRHPFGLELLRDEPVLSLARAVIAGTVRPAPASSDVPERVRAVLLRGLAVDPERRYPAMTDLLEDLAGVLAPAAAAHAQARAWKLPAGIAAGVAAAALGWWLTAGRGPPPPSAAEARCGNGRVERGEECDDGNAVEGDGCSAGCLRCRSGDARFVWDGSGHCYSRHDTPAAWAQARQLCAAAGGDLVTYTSKAEAQAVFRALLRNARAPTWIGLAARRPGDALAWVSGEPTHVTSHFWGAGEPRLEAGGCVAEASSIRPTHPDGPSAPWQIQDCRSQAGFVCEQIGWRRRARSRSAYLVVLQPAPWAAAAADCRTRGGHLATITDAEQQAFVAAQALVDVWIGGSDAASEGAFVWTTGEPFVFRAFAPNEPDQDEVGLATADCLAIGLDRGWHDRDCAMPHAYVCEVE